MDEGVAGIAPGLEGEEPSAPPTAPAVPSPAHRDPRSNRGAELDRLARVIPVGAALEFVRGLPRRSTREELIAYLEALVRLMQVEERRR